MEKCEIYQNEWATSVLESVFSLEIQMCSKYLLNVLKTMNFLIKNVIFVIKLI